METPSPSRPLPSPASGPGKTHPLSVSGLAVLSVLCTRSHWAPSVSPAHALSWLRSVPPGLTLAGAPLPPAPGLGRCGARMSTSPPSVRWAGEGLRVAPGSDRLLRTCRTVLRLHMVPSRQPGTRARLGGPRAVPQLSGLTIAAGVESQLTAADLQFPSD